MKTLGTNICLLLFLMIMAAIGPCLAQHTAVEGDDWKLALRKNGRIESIHFKSSGHTVPFNTGEHAGPVWYYKKDGALIVPDNITFEGHGTSARYDDLEFGITYLDEGGKLLVKAQVTNHGHVPFQPTTLGLKLGIDTYMDRYPDWESKYFPTLLRCEKNYFWGYFMSPKERILTIASPDPVASWSHEYSKSWGTPPYRFDGHRITSVNIDLVNTLPLPERHPQHLWQIAPGETKVFRLYFDEIETLDSLEGKIRDLTGAATIEMERTVVERGAPMPMTITGAVDVSVKHPDGTLTEMDAEPGRDGNHVYSYRGTDRQGDYEVTAISADGKISRALFHVRKPYSWYMQQGMQAVVDYPQKASASHCEAWYGFYTSYAGGKYFRDHGALASADDQFRNILPRVFDSVSMRPLAAEHRIQNFSTMIGILVDRYQLFHDETDLKKALLLADHLLEAQSEDGAYRAGNTHYTSVIYIGKSLMELLEVLRPHKNRFKKEYDRIYASIEKAMDELERNRTDVQTEGEQTFEDGMVSCTALQLGAFALLQDNRGQRQKYAEAALEVLGQHECLEQLKVPDARMRSGSLRFWEAQYDVLMANNFLNSPHGWSSWATYANYYAYLLSGETKYLVRTFNGLDAAMQTISLEDGSLSWAFMVNPFVEVTQIRDNIPGATPIDFPGVHYHAEMFGNERFITGESYVDMVSDWFYANANDNDAHEHFKCLEEIALDKAYVVQTGDGQWLAFNCRVEMVGDVLEITPSEDIVNQVHLNLQEATKVEWPIKGKTKKQYLGEGMHWLR